jgi:Na+(H+)/acetate symporter ActP
MKATVWTVVILLVFIVAIGIASTVISSKVSRDFSQDLTVAEDSIRSKDWEKAKKAVESMRNEWEDTCQ